jgi:hypothetical protein
MCVSCRRVNPSVRWLAPGEQTPIPPIAGHVPEGS